MKYIEAPQEYDQKDGEISLFVAGGITGTSKWQDDFIDLLKDQEVTLVNPRRKDFDISDLDMEEEQITWEHKYLEKADAISFWFPPETLCPITLFELGAHLQGNKPIFIGIHPEYKRKRDLEIQSRLVDPNIQIVYSLEELADLVKNWVKKRSIATFVI